MTDLETLLTYLTLISVPIGVFYHIMTLNNTRKNQKQQLETRQAQLLMQIYQRMSSPEYCSDWAKILNYEWDSFEDFELKYGSDGHPELFGRVASICRGFDGLGFLVKEGLLDVDKVYELLGLAVILQWEKFGEYIKQSRVHFNTHNWMKGFEYIADQTYSIRSQRGETAIPLETSGRYIPEE